MPHSHPPCFSFQCLCKLLRQVYVLLHREHANFFVTSLLLTWFDNIIYRSSLVTRVIFWYLFSWVNAPPSTRILNWSILIFRQSNSSANAIVCCLNSYRCTVSLKLNLQEYGEQTLLFRTDPRRDDAYILFFRHATCHTSKFACLLKK